MRSLAAVQRIWAAGGMGGGSTQVNLDYGGKDPMTAQVDEIVEKNWYPGLPTFLVKSDSGYTALPLGGATASAKQAVTPEHLIDFRAA